MKSASMHNINFVLKIPLPFFTKRAHLHTWLYHVFCICVLPKGALMYTHSVYGFR